jgi:hypothetical protein
MEYPLPSTNIGIAGYEDLGGITDYAIGELDIPTSAGIFPVSFSDVINISDRFLPTGLVPPALVIPNLAIIVEAKSTKTIDDVSSAAEAIGAMFILSAREYVLLLPITNGSPQRGHNGLLTNGHQFTFLYVEGHNVYSSAPLHSRNPKEKFEILGTFVFLSC